MEAFVTASAYFTGSHALKDHPYCGRDCGHEWKVEVTVTGEELPEHYGMPVDDVTLEAMLDEAIIEISGKDIDKMIKPARSSPIGLAHWFLARFAGRYVVTEVTVWRGNHLSATLRAP